MGSIPGNFALAQAEPKAPAPWPAVEVIASVNKATMSLDIEWRSVIPTEERYAQCLAATKAGFPILVGPGKAIIERPCVLVGSGLSAITLLPEIRQRYERGEEIIAIKGAHDWLVKNDIIPRAAIALDPQKSRAKCFKRLRREVLYLCASQMHSDTWEHLRGYQVLLWHSRIALEQEKRPGWGSAYLVPGCSTTGNSAICLLYLLGRRRFELYGFDSSLPPAASWHQSLMWWLKGRLLKLDGARVPKDRQVVEVLVGGERFHTTAELVMQAQEVPLLLQQLPEVKVNAHGRGYYQALLAAGKAQGWPV